MLSKTQAKYIQSLVHKKFREQYGQYVVEGPKLLSEAISGNKSGICKIYAYSEWIAQSGQMLHKEGIEVVQVNEDEMMKISFLSTPVSVLAIMNMTPKPIPLTFHGITLLLDGIQDPGNLGTIIRTADWFGLSHIICGEGSADCYNPKVIQSTMGSIFRMNIIYRDLVSVLDQFSAIPVMASSLQGALLNDVKKVKDCFLVIGNESKGISESIMTRSAIKVRIPGGGEVESLNAAVATGILLNWLCVES